MVTLFSGHSRGELTVPVTVCTRHTQGQARESEIMQWGFDQEIPSQAEEILATDGYWNRDYPFSSEEQPLVG